jgi:hypothetical protein
MEIIIKKKSIINRIMIEANKKMHSPIQENISNYYIVDVFSPNPGIKPVKGYELSNELKHLIIALQIEYFG